MSKQDSSENNEALNMYSRASSDVSQLRRAVINYHLEKVDGSEDEDIDAASSFNEQRRENAIIRKLNAKKHET